MQNESDCIWGFGWLRLYNGGPIPIISVNKWSIEAAKKSVKKNRMMQKSVD